MAETKALELLLDVNHLYVLVGILGIIYFLKTIKPIAAFIFSDKWKWTVSFINLALSATGIFLLKMTSATTLGLKLVVMFLITAVTTASYEYTKPAIQRIVAKLFKTE